MVIYKKKNIFLFESTVIVVPATFELGPANSKFEFFQLLESLVYSRVISFPRKSFVPHSPSHFLR
jgi:hypothetical protein